MVLTNDEVVVKGEEWNWVDELLYRLNEGGAGIEFYNSGGMYVKPIYKVRN